MFYLAYTNPKQKTIMKKILFSLIFLAIAGSASAQFSKGSYYLGGSLNYNYDEAGTTTTYTYAGQGVDVYTNNHLSDFQIAPDFGIFLTDKLAIGLQIGYTRDAGQEINNYTAEDVVNSYVSTDHYSTSALGIGLHVRYYWMLTKQIGIFPQFGITTSNNLNNFNYGTLSIGGNPNIVFFATPRLGINLGFGNLEYDMDYATKTYTFNFGLNTNISFGLNYYWK
jgi:hypothetical protein